MNEKRPISVLIAPLDWGLGHATRCIPIINELVKQGAVLTVAASGSVKDLLKLEWPFMEFVEIPGYNIKYQKGFFLKWGLVLNLRKILRKIKQENVWLEKILEIRKIDLVIADNRYGLFNKKSYCVFITHQLAIQSGWNESAGRWPLTVGRWIDRKILKWNYRFIEKFSCCWIPDWKGEDSIAGSLSHPEVLPRIPAVYIGALSRFKKNFKKTVEGTLLILFSGPEPQRTEFENQLFEQIIDSPMQTVVVRGLPGSGAPVPFIKEGVKIYNHLLSGELNDMIEEAEIIITRSGYSTIMDLIRLGKSAILVPTPGQTEQEYLAAFMQGKKWMYHVPQKNFKLANALNAFRNMEKQFPANRDYELHDVIKELLIKVSGKMQQE